MEELAKVLLIAHIVCGTAAVLSAPVAMVTKKGSKGHRISGKAYFFAMTGVAATGIGMALIRDSLFILLVGVFSYHLVVGGYRALYLKKLHRGQKPALVDWIINGVAGLFNLGLLAWAFLVILKNPNHPFGYIALVFGIIGMLFVFGTLRSFFKPPKEKQAWLYNHIGGMVGGFIASVSALSAINFDFLPPLVQWLWPTVIGVPMIFLWIGYYRKKFKKGAEAGKLAEVRINTEE